MYYAAIKAIPKIFHTLGRMGVTVSMFFKEKGVLPQYFVTDYLNF